MTAPSPPERILARRPAGGPGEARRGRRSVDIEPLLLLLPLLVAVPLLGYAGFLLYVTAGRAADHARREQAAAHAAVEAGLVDELQRLEEIIVVVARSPALTEGDLQLRSATSLAQAVVDARLGLDALAVVAPGGETLLEYPPRAAAHKPVQLPPRLLQVFETGKAAVSDLQANAVDGRLTVSLAVPVTRGERTPWIIIAVVDPVHLSRTLSAHVGARDALSTVLDGGRRILARSRELQRFYGQLPSGDTLRALDSGDRGWRRFRTRDGNEYLWTWSTIAPGWSVWLGSPAREFDEALRRSMLRLGAAGLAVLLVATTGTALLARRMAGSVRRIAEDAARLTEGERPPYHPSGIRQLDALYGAVEEANARVTAALADRQRALEAERAARAVADEHNRSKDLFLGMLSHELRNPLTPIRNATHVLQRAPAGSEPAQRARRAIERQTDHLTRLVDDLLDVTRIARGKIELRREPLDLAAVVARAADDFCSLLGDRGVAFRADLPAAPLQADADPTRITQIVGNLLHNAAKFTRRGDEVVLSLAADGTDAELRVRDSGTGIHPALLPRVFEAFVQADDSLARTQGGLGLGLALVKGLAELHGGSARAESAGEGRGAEFVVRIPLRDAAPAADAAVGRETAPS